MTQPAADDRIIESCLFCNVKVRIHPSKVLQARCPQCKGPIGDPKLDQPCATCGAVNRVFRSRLANARCGKCKDPLHRGEVPRELIIADLYATIGAIYADPRLAGRRMRPRDLVEAVSVLEEQPAFIAEIAANMPPSPERDKLAALIGRCKALPAKIRPLAFEDSAVLHSPEMVERYMLGESFEALRHHPAGFDFLRRARRADPGPVSAREELGCARVPFERLLDRLHKPDWNDPAADRQRRQGLAGQLFHALVRVLELWMPRPYKLDAMVKSAMMRVGEMNGAADALAQHEAAMREDVAAFLAIGTAGVARAVVFHGLAPEPKDAWARIQAVLHAALQDA